MKNNDVVELLEDTQFYKKGQKAIVINNCGDSPKFEIRYCDEKYLGGDVYVMPKKLFRLVNANWIEILFRE